MKLDEQLETRFRCDKCSNVGGQTKRIATSGAGLSKLLDLQHNQYLMVSCTNCGYTEVYNPEILEGKRQLGNVLDILFGG